MGGGRPPWAPTWGGAKMNQKFYFFMDFCKVFEFFRNFCKIAVVFYEFCNIFVFFMKFSKISYFFTNFCYIFVFFYEFLQNCRSKFFLLLGAPNLVEGAKFGVATEVARPSFGVVMATPWRRHCY